MKKKTKRRFGKRCRVPLTNLCIWGRVLGHPPVSGGPFVLGSIIPYTRETRNLRSIDTLTKKQVSLEGRSDRPACRIQRNGDSQKNT